MTLEILLRKVSALRHGERTSEGDGDKRRPEVTESKSQWEHRTSIENTIAEVRSLKDWRDLTMTKSKKRNKSSREDYLARSRLW